MAAVTVDTSLISTEQYTTITQAITIANNVGRVLLVQFGYTDTAVRGAPTSVTYNGVAMMLVASKERTGSTMPMGNHVYFLANPDTGTHNIVATFTGTYVSARVQAVSLYNAYQGIPNSVTADGRVTTITCTLSGLADGQIIDFIASSGLVGNAYTPGAGQTQLQQAGGNATRVRSCSSRENAGTNIVMDWTMASVVDWTTIAVAINPLAGRTLQAVSFGGGG